MSMQALFLERLADVLVDDILAMSEEELRQEMIENHMDPEAEIQGMRRLIALATERAMRNSEAGEPEIDHRLQEAIGPAYRVMDGVQVG